jgi:hypothetical protein
MIHAVPNFGGRGSRNCNYVDTDSTCHLCQGFIGPLSAIPFPDAYLICVLPLPPVANFKGVTRNLYAMLQGFQRWQLSHIDSALGLLAVLAVSVFV